jgi:Lar family restriction alleviation protein
MTAPDLLPCPFCGGEAKIDGTSWTPRDGKDQAWATCKKCGTYGPSSTNAITAWNTRAALSTSPEVQELIRAAVEVERERCASLAGCYDLTPGLEAPNARNQSARDIAAAIRLPKP